MNWHAEGCTIYCGCNIVGLALNPEEARRIAAAHNRTADELQAMIEREAGASI